MMSSLWLDRFITFPLQGCIGMLLEGAEMLARATVFNVHWIMKIGVTSIQEAGEDGKRLNVGDL